MSDFDPSSVPKKEEIYLVCYSIFYEVQFTLPPIYPLHLSTKLFLSSNKLSSDSTFKELKRIGAKTNHIRARTNQTFPRMMEVLAEVKEKRFLWCLVGYNNGATYGQILSLKEQQLFKGFAIFGTLGKY
ncbi:hypothetical protein BpHYR1_029854 [Brachionus plicatilis]|uniref:Uncharacterized protein n=1 Tax=Brachionus plicatilis TaxID=10195 RepID=A0A3M7QH68_BRAPC|nr:hypothetical protein BpHYR1_029854 [Brachionus plicatilis]